MLSGATEGSPGPWVPVVGEGSKHSTFSFRDQVAPCLSSGEVGGGDSGALPTYSQEPCYKNETFLIEKCQVAEIWKASQASLSGRCCLLFEPHRVHPNFLLHSHMCGTHINLQMSRLLYFTGCIFFFFLSETEFYYIVEARLASNLQ